MKSLLVLIALFATHSAFAGTETVYPSFNGKNVTKLCYNSESDNFTYTYKTVFGKVKSKKMSRVSQNVGDCTKYVMRRKRAKDSFEKVCVETAKETLFFPLTVTAKVYEVKLVGKPGRHGDRRLERTLVNEFDYDIKDCL